MALRDAVIQSHVYVKKCIHNSLHNFLNLFNPIAESASRNLKLQHTVQLKMPCPVGDNPP